jgi:hypothetical protein
MRETFATLLMGEGRCASDFKEKIEENHRGRFTEAKSYQSRQSEAAQSSSSEAATVD